MKSSDAEGSVTVRARPLFSLVFAARAALEAPGRHAVLAMAMSTQHVPFDRGYINSEDATRYEIGMLSGGRILSPYAMGDSSVPLWIVTEAGRMATSLVLQEDY